MKVLQYPHLRSIDLFKVCAAYIKEVDKQLLKITLQHYYKNNRCEKGLFHAIFQ